MKITAKTAVSHASGMTAANKAVRGHLSHRNNQGTNTQIKATAGKKKKIQKTTPNNRASLPPPATQINWNWGSNSNVNFDAASDTLDFGWFQADQFTISEVNGTVVIAIPSNQQTYTLQHTTLHDLHPSNIIAKDASAIGEWTTVL